MFFLGDARYSASIESIRAHSLALGDRYMAESSPVNSPNQSRRESQDDNNIENPISPVLLPVNETHSILSNLLKHHEREPLIKRHKSKDYHTIEQDHHLDPELGPQDNTLPPSPGIEQHRSFKHYTKQDWIHCFTQPVSYIPAVILGLLLNLLDAISYGMITFPLNNPIFASFGPDGISMFFVR